MIFKELFMDFLEAISHNWSAALLCAAVLLIIIGAYMYLRYYTMKRLFDNDALYERYDDDGNLEEKGYIRNDV